MGVAGRGAEQHDAEAAVDRILLDDVDLVGRRHVLVVVLAVAVEVVLVDRVREHDRRADADDVELAALEDVVQHDVDVRAAVLAGNEEVENVRDAVGHALQQALERRERV